MGGIIHRCAAVLPKHYSCFTCNGQTSTIRSKVSLSFDRLAPVVDWVGPPVMEDFPTAFAYRAAFSARSNERRSYSPAARFVGVSDPLTKFINDFNPCLTPPDTLVTPPCH